MGVHVNLEREGMHIFTGELQSQPVREEEHILAICTHILWVLGYVLYVSVVKGSALNLQTGKQQPHASAWDGDPGVMMSYFVLTLACR